MSKFCDITQLGNSLIIQTTYRKFVHYSTNCSIICKATICFIKQTICFINQLKHENNKTRVLFQHETCIKLFFQCSLLYFVVDYLHFPCEIQEVMYNIEKILIMVIMIFLSLPHFCLLLVISIGLNSIIFQAFFALNTIRTKLQCDKDLIHPLPHCYLSLTLALFIILGLLYYINYIDLKIIMPECMWCKKQTWLVMAVEACRSLV